VPRTIHVVTHPEATHHVDGLVGGQFDSDLTHAGLADAQAIGAALRARVPAGGDICLVSSDLRRTWQTALAIAEHLDVVPVADPRLREKSYGEAEGRSQAWLDERFVPPPATGERMHHHEGIRGSETRAQLATRAYAALERVLAQEVEHHVVVTHGYAAQLFIAGWLGLPIEAAGLVGFALTSGGITELHQNDRLHNRALVRLNDTTHLTTR